MADNKDVGSGPVEQPRAQDYQPYDACSDADVGPFVKMSAHIPYGTEAQWRTEYPDSGPWMQT